MQQNSATLLYDLNTMKGTTESYLKKQHSHSKQYSSRPEKSHLVLKVSKKQKTVLSHLKHKLTAELTMNNCDLYLIFSKRPLPPDAVCMKFRMISLMTNHQRQPVHFSFIALNKKSQSFFLHFSNLKVLVWASILYVIFGTADVLNSARFVLIFVSQRSHRRQPVCSW